MACLGETPCPQCSKRCHMMAGVNVPGGDTRETYLVCWTCGLRNQVPSNDWLPIRSPKSQAVQWIKRSPHHWRTLIKGEILDYWPTKKKFRFEGQMRHGNPEKFVRELQ